MTTTTTPIKLRAATKDVTFSIGMLSCNGDLYTLTVPNAGAEEKLKLVCPTCAGLPGATIGQFPSQKYLCNDDPSHEPFTVSEAARGQLVDGKVVIVNGDIIQEARRSILPERELDLQVHMRADVEAHTFEAGTAYVFKPTGKSKFYGILVDLLTKRRDICLLAKTNLKKTDHLVMVDVGLNGNLIVRDMIWPQDMNAFERETWDYQAGHFTQAEMLIDASVETFDPAEYRRDSRDRIRQAVEDASGAAPTTTKAKGKTKKADTVSSEDDMLTKALEAALNAKKGKSKAS